MSLNTPAGASQAPKSLSLNNTKLEPTLGGADSRNNKKLRFCKSDKRRHAEKFISPCSI